MDDDYDEAYEAGVMQGSVSEFAGAVIGSRIVRVEKRTNLPGYGNSNALDFTLDNGNVVTLADTDDCCAYTMVENFEFLEGSENAITSVDTQDGFQTWFVYAEGVPVVRMGVDWSPGNPYYYGFGFNVTVKEKEATNGND